MSAFLQAGLAVAAVCTMLLAIVGIFNGFGLAIGSQVRDILEPTLRSIRDRSELSRQDLADRTLLGAAAICAVGSLATLSFAGLFIGGLLLFMRPSVRRATREENKMLALSSSFSLDLIVGFFVPMVLAMVLLGDVVMSLTYFLATIALCWPPGGAGGRRRVAVWKPAWVHS